MRIASITTLACLLAPAAAARGDGEAPVSVAGTGESVIGGTAAKAGAWPDVAAILFPSSSGEEARCTGTLVAPSIVLTAGHCFDPAMPPDKVLIGTSSLARPGEGETIAIQRGQVYPDADLTEDLAVLVLARPSSRPPRKIATGWARADLVNGATVSLVGFGAINAAGDQFVDALQQASSTITDVDCAASPGCNPGARPAGELGAGGMGVDTCPGDSGGPLYLSTGYGFVLAGVTSRSYDSARLPCSEGGIYVRPDKVIDWIEQVAGGPVARITGPEAAPLEMVHGDGGDTRIDVNDPASDAHRFEITTPPAHGTAKVRGDGAVRVCADPAATPGADAVTVTITDTRHDHRALALTIPIQIDDGAPPAACDLDAFSDDGGCCSAGGRPGGAIVLAIAVLGRLLRPRRARR